MFRSKNLLAPAVVLAAVASLVLGAGPAAGTTAHLSLATSAQVSQYLTSRGIDPHGVVVQRGVRNYAGPSCPGRGWTCTSAKRVLQLGMANQFVCAPGSGTGTSPDQTCTIVQPGGINNTATCTEYETVDVGTQDCSITQGGTGTNSATVTQSITSAGGPTQHAQQTAEVTQSGATVKNAFKLVQTINQSTKALGPSVTQTQDAFQATTVDQTASGGGVNSADQHQTQIQKASAGTSQFQNTASDGPPDCDPSNPPTAPNICANVQQTADAGDNNNYLDQSLSENEQTDVVATQTQGTFGGGLDGGVHLVSTTGKSNDNAHQKKTQAMTAPPGSIQTQHDPLGCCGVSAFGNDNTKETVDQSSTQHASDPDAVQDLEIIGTSNSNGSCTITQKGSNNNDSSGGTLTESPCPFAQQDTFCDVEGCFTTTGGDGGLGLAARPFLFGVRR